MVKQILLLDILNLNVFIDKNVDKKNLANSSDSESDDDSSKRQKLNDGLPKTSGECSESKECERASDFRKFMSKIKDRNYRRQSTSCDNAEEEEAIEEPIADHESSNSIPSVGSLVNPRVFDDSSDERSQSIEGI